MKINWIEVLSVFLRFHFFWHFIFMRDPGIVWHWHWLCSEIFWFYSFWDFIFFRLWYYLTLTLPRSWHCLWFHFFFRFHFFFFLRFLFFFLIWFFFWGFFFFFWDFIFFFEISFYFFWDFIYFLVFEKRSKEETKI